MITLDATNQAPGRLATRITVLLRGKDKPRYQPNVLGTERITVTNAAKMKFTGRKLDQKTYYHYSGYPGGMKARVLKEQLARDPTKVLRLAVYRMLPPNRQRSKLMTHLTITP